MNMPTCKNNAFIAMVVTESEVDRQIELTSIPKPENTECDQNNLTETKLRYGIFSEKEMVLTNTMDRMIKSYQPFLVCFLKIVQKIYSLEANSSANSSARDYNVDIRNRLILVKACCICSREQVEQKYM